VTVTVRDAEGTLIAHQDIVHFHRPGRGFLFRSRRPGVQRLMIKPIAGGRLRVTIKARHFFPSWAAAQLTRPAALELEFGDAGCVRHAVTRRLVQCESESQ
jgi:hypothetical protein